MDINQKSKVLMTTKVKINFAVKCLVSMRSAPFTIHEVSFDVIAPQIAPVCATATNRCVN